MKKQLISIGIVCTGLAYGCNETTGGSNDSSQSDSVQIRAGDTVPADTGTVSINDTTGNIMDEEETVSQSGDVLCVFTVDETQYDIPPVFGETESTLAEYMKANVAYPDSLKQTGVAGTVLVQVSIDATGKVVHASIRRSLHPVLDANCLAAVRAMPLWKPAVKDKKPIGTNIVLPVTFKLPE